MRQTKIFNLIKKIDKLPIRIFAVLMGCGAFVQLLEFLNITYFKNDIIHFAMFFMIACLATEFVRFFKNTTTQDSENLNDLIIRDAERMLDEGRNEEIIRRRHSLSRHLWIEGKPQERIRLGEIARQAAIKISDKRVLAEVLIDDLGWTSISIKEYAKALDYITHGETYAIEINDFYLVAKANRHLSGLYVDANDLKQARKKMALALSYAKKMSNSSKKDEMLGGIYYALSIISIKQKNPHKALKYILKSEAFRNKVGDKTRTVRIYSLKGTIYEILRQFNLAEENFITGFNQAKIIARTDEIIKNCLGLARIEKEKRNQVRYEYYYNLAQDLARNSTIHFSLDEKEIKLTQI